MVRSTPRRHARTASRSAFDALGGGGLWRAAAAWAAALSVVAFSGALAQPFEAPRFAAVISVEAYPAPLGPARGAAADGAHVAAAFAEAGYQVRAFPEATAGDMRRAAFWLAENLSAAGPEAVGAVYVAAHAATVDNRAYLLGADAVVTSRRAIAASGAPADVFARTLADAEAASVIILDASARHPIADRLAPPRGLAAFDPPARGLVILDNPPGVGAPGRGDGVSPFARGVAALLASANPPRTALRAFRDDVYEASLGWRSPWVSGRLPAGTRLHGRSAVDDAAPAETQAPEPEAPRRDVLFLTTRQVIAPALAADQPNAAPAGAVEHVAAERTVVFADAADAFLTRGWARREGIAFVSEDEVAAAVTGAAVLVYVHGANTSLREAAEEAAALARGIGHGGRIVAFAWPAQSERSPVAYRRDRRAAEHGGAALAGALEQLRQAGPAEINIAAYGLGARTATAALELLAARRRPPPPEAPAPAPPFLHAMLIAPDLPPDNRRARLAAAAGLATVTTLVLPAEDPSLAVAAWGEERAPDDGSAARARWIADARAVGASVIAIDGAADTPAPRTSALARALGPAVAGLGGAPAAAPDLRDAIRAVPPR